MIIYGSKAVHLKSEQSKTITCPSCGTKGSVVFSVYRKHTHIFWVPLFPIGKRGVSQCQHCQRAYKVNEMPQGLKSEYDLIKSESRGPIWQFAGLLLIAVFITMAAVSSNNNKKLEAGYLAAPEAGDVYRYKTEEGNYSSLKVLEVAQDSILIAANDYETDKRKGVNSIDKAENYNTYVYSISKDEIDKMYHEGEIYDINR